jgi:hypothetical protein
MSKQKSEGGFSDHYPYPLPMPEMRTDEQIAVSFPLADSFFKPSLFQPSEQWPNLNRSGMRHLKNAYQVLYATMEDMGYLVNRCAPSHASVVFDWSEKNDSYSYNKARIIMEHGWLPRSSYQLSAHGTNARSHVAQNFRLGSLEPEQAHYVMNQVAVMRQIFESVISTNRTDQLWQLIAKPFIFFPLQLATDFNLKFSNSPLAHYYSIDPQANVALAQACVNMMERADLPLPVVYKQHPADKTVLGNVLKFRDQRSILIENKHTISSLDLLSSGLCQLVVSINSNTLHEALMFSLPVIALGSLLWQERVDSRPFAGALHAAKDLIGHDPLRDASTQHYLYQLFANQWYLSDFQNPLMVRALIENQANCVPLELRRQFGFGTTSALC